jgi:DNA-directed RNA polymerase specialized sigma24 family protein
MALPLRRRHRRRLAAFCRAMLGSADAGDALAAAVLAAGPYPRVAGRRVGLYRLAFERCRATPAGPLAAPGIAHDLALLPEDQRAAILLRHAEGLSHAQIATVLGASAAAVPSMLVAARLSLADAAAARKAGDHTIDSSVNWVESRAA